MATGLAIPPRADTTGGVALSSGSSKDNELIALALGSDENLNSFQQNIGLGDDMIFDINDPLGQAQILGRLRTVFNKFTRLKRFMLLENTIAFTQIDGDMILSFKYLPMETDAEPQTFTSALGSSTGAPLAVPSTNAT